MHNSAVGFLVIKFFGARGLDGAMLQPRTATMTHGPVSPLPQSIDISGAVISMLGQNRDWRVVLVNDEREYESGGGVVFFELEYEQEVPVRSVLLRLRAPMSFDRENIVQLLDTERKIVWSTALFTIPANSANGTLVCNIQSDGTGSCNRQAAAFSAAAPPIGVGRSARYVTLRHPAGSGPLSLSNLIVRMPNGSQFTPTAGSISNMAPGTPLTYWQNLIGPGTAAPVQSQDGETTVELDYGTEVTAYSVAVLLGSPKPVARSEEIRLLNAQRAVVWSTIFTVAAGSTVADAEFRVT